MRILFMVCGRAGSKGIKNKNIRMFSNYPLPLYSLAVMEMFKEKHPNDEVDIALNTDSDELKNIISKFDDSVSIVNRKEELAGDRVAKRDVIIDTLAQMEEKKKCIYDAVVDLDITSPIRKLEDVEKAITKYEESGADVVFSVVPSRRNPYFNMVKPSDKGAVRALESNFVARQQAPEMFDMNASIYVYRPTHLRAGRGVLEGYNEMIEMYDTGILDLDHESDFELLEVIANHLYNNVDGYSDVLKFLEVKASGMKKES